MNVKVETVSPVEKKVTVEVDPGRVAKELDRAYAGLSRRVKLKGFRPGKAPRQVLERHFREQVENEVVQKLVESTYREVVDTKDLAPVAAPHVSIAEPGLQGVAEGKPLTYTARVEVKPKLSPRDYKGLEVVRKPPEVTDEKVSDELARIQDGLAQLVPVEGRAVALENDYVNVDLDGAVAGAPFEGSKAEDVTFQVKPGDFAESNLEQAKGHAVGDVVELDYAFPAAYRVEALRNKVAHFKVTLKALKVRQMPALDDELAKDLGLEGVDSLDKLKARIREDIEKREKQRSENELRDALIKAALARNDFEVPSSLIERSIDGMLQGALDRFARQGIDVRQLDLDLARLRGDLREQAVLQVKGALLLEAIADAEKIEASEDDVQAEIARMANELKAPLAKVQASLRSADAKSSLKSKIREDKALALMTSEAKIK